MAKDAGKAGAPLLLTDVLGSVHDQSWHDRAHAAETQGSLETVRIARADAPRRRMRLQTDKGRDVALALPRDVTMTDGAVLLAEPHLIIVVRVDWGPRLRLVPQDAASALRLGYFCGNLHWKADFVDGAIDVHMDGPEDAYRARLADAEALCAFSVQRQEAEE